MKLREFLDNHHGLVKKYGHLLDHPIFTVRWLRPVVKSLTYGKVNTWDSKGLLSSSREKSETGWRKFSIIDSVKLNIISNLRKAGFPRKQLRVVMDKLNCGNIGLWSPRETRVLGLISLGVADFTIACLFGVKMFIVIRENEETFFLSETGAKSFCSHSDNELSFVIRLPFYSYVKKTVAVMKDQMKLDNNSTIEELFASMLPYQEERISGWIQSRNYREILFRKSEFEKTRIKPGSIKDKKYSTKNILEAIDAGDYYSIDITTSGKQIVRIVRKEWMAK